MRSERLVALVPALAVAAGVVGCKLDAVAIPRTEPQLAVHAVLSASASSQVVILERTRSGRIDIMSPSVDLGDYIPLEDGVAESGASMALVFPDGSVVNAIEDVVARGDGKGAGIYRFYIPGASLPRGGTYRLDVHTLGGETLTATTSLPDGTVATTAARATLDRAGDTLALAWPAAAGARSYLVRIETPFGARTFFTDSTHVRLPGLLRNLDVDELPHVFFPGFMQAVTVSAVDSNFYDWYRSHSDPLTGTGLIDRVSGGVGVFGALVRLRFDSLDVTAPRTRPAEGTFTLDATAPNAAAARYSRFELWIEAPAARSGQSDALSGRYDAVPRFGYEGCATCGLLGAAHDGHVELALLKDWSGHDTVEVFAGTLRGDTLAGIFRYGGGAFRFVRQR